MSRSEFWDMLATLRERGITILVSTSYMDEAERCEQIALINKGRILDVDTPGKLADTLGRNIYNASSANMYRLLEALRTLRGVSNCYTFGATLHIEAGEGFNPDNAVHELYSMGITDASIYPAKGNIEDLFIKLARNDE